MAIHKKVFRSGRTTLVVSNEELDDIKKVIKSYEISGLLVKDIGKTIKNE